MYIYVPPLIFRTGYFFITRIFFYKRKRELLVRGRLNIPFRLGKSISVKFTYGYEI